MGRAVFACGIDWVAFTEVVDGQIVGRQLVLIQDRLGIEFHQARRMKAAIHSISHLSSE